MFDFPGLETKHPIQHTHAPSNNGFHLLWGEQCAHTVCVGCPVLDLICICLSFYDTQMNSYKRTERPRHTHTHTSTIKQKHGGWRCEPEIHVVCAACDIIPSLLCFRFSSFLFFRLVLVFCSFYYLKIRLYLKHIVFACDAIDEKRKLAHCFNRSVCCAFQISIAPLNNETGGVFKIGIELRSFAIIIW